MWGSKHQARLVIRIQSVDTGLFLTRKGQWAQGYEALEKDSFCTDPVEGIRLCLRLGVKNVRFTAWNLRRGTAISLYPFGGDPSHKAELKQLRKNLAEQRRVRSARIALQAKIKTLEQVQHRA